MAYSIEDAISKMDHNAENFIIGGGSIYNQFLPLANKLYLTLVHKEFEADTFFPAIHFEEWNTVSSSENSDDHVSYTFIDLERK
jgi:dihydrofolate reductase